MSAVSYQEFLGLLADHGQVILPTILASFAPGAELDYKQIYDEAILAVSAKHPITIIVGVCQCSTTCTDYARLLDGCDMILAGYHVRCRAVEIPEHEQADTVTFLAPDIGVFCYA